MAINNVLVNNSKAKRGMKRCRQGDIDIIFYK